jgi:autoinducer 2-degrading protein
MFVVAVTVFVERERVSEFVQAILDNARDTRTEPGNLRFDVSQCNDDPSRFLLYEVYRDEEAFKAHQQTPHYLRWRETVADWMARPRQGVKHTSLFPADDAW